MGELRPLEISTWKWDSFSIDIVMGLPISTTKNNVIWIIVDRFTKSAHFLLIPDMWDVEMLGQLYVKKIVRLHVILANIVLDRE